MSLLSSSTAILFAADSIPAPAHPDQHRMELLFAGIPECRKRKRLACLADSGSFIDVCAWGPVKCNDSQKIVKFVAKSFAAGGSVDLSHMPVSVQEFTMSNCNFMNCRDTSKTKGTLETAALPKKLKVFNITFNHFHGTVDCLRLPPRLTALSLTSNDFTGSCDLSNLPKRLTKLGIASNQFSGGLNFTALPEKLEEMFVGYNNFAGEIVFANIPPGLKMVSMQENSLSGPFAFAVNHPLPCTIMAYDNEFSGRAVIHRNQTSVELFNTNVTEVHTEEGKPHLHQAAILQKLVTSENAHVKNIGDLQLATMLRFLHEVEFPQGTVQFMHVTQGMRQRTLTNACAWRGVECTDGLVESILVDPKAVLFDRGRKKILVDMDWIPGTAKYVRLDTVYARNRWLVERLPRDLRSLMMTFVHVASNTHSERKINLSVLPRRMEELFLIKGWYEGPVHIANLPASMRVIEIVNAGLMQAAVDFAGLPLGFEAMIVANMKAKEGEAVRIRGLGMTGSDPRVTNSRKKSLDSKYTWRY